MSINLIRFLASQKKRAERYHTDALRYRGVVYKEIDWFRKSGLGSAMFPFSIGVGPYEDTLRRLDGGNRPQKFFQTFEAC